MATKKGQRKTKRTTRREQEATVAKAFEAKSDEGRKLRRVLHSWLAADAYCQEVRPAGEAVDSASILRSTARDYAHELVVRMKPRDPLEEMLAQQCLLAHGRVCHLSSLANQQTSLSAIRQVNDSADKATNTFRRLMLALAEYRRPRKGGDSFTAIKQANIAQQQVVQNQASEKKNPSNEQGCTHDAAASSATDDEQPKALPTDAGGTGIAADERPTHAAVDVVDGPANRRG